MNRHHPYVPNPWGKPICDAKLDDDGRIRLCGEKPEHEVHQAPAQPVVSAQVPR